MKRLKLIELEKEIAKEAKMSHLLGPSIKQYILDACIMMNC